MTEEAARQSRAPQADRADGGSPSPDLTRPSPGLLDITVEPGVPAGPKTLPSLRLPAPPRYTDEVDPPARLRYYPDKLEPEAGTVTRDSKRTAGEAKEDEAHRRR